MDKLYGVAYSCLQSLSEFIHVFILYMICNVGGSTNGGVRYLRKGLSFTEGQ